MGKPGARVAWPWENTTFRDPGVQRKLQQFVKVKFRAEDPFHSPAKEVLAYLDVKGCRRT